MKKVLKKSLLVLSIPAALSGCATIMGNNSYPVRISSNPAGAHVSVTNRNNKEIYKGSTPAQVKLNTGGAYLKKPQYKISLSAPGFADHTETIYFRLNGWYYGNLLFGGIVGMLIVDPVTGSMWKTDTQSISPTLTTSGTSQIGPSLEIIDIKAIPDSLRSSLVKIN